VESAETILAAQSPSEALLQFLKRLAMLSTQIAQLGENVREALSSLAVSVAAETIWPKEADAVRQMTRTTSPLFPLFKVIYERSDHRLFPEVMTQIRMEADGQEQDKAFARLLSRRCGKDLGDAIMAGGNPSHKTGAAEGLVEYRLAVPDKAPLRR
jgi:hypothetical protein